MTPGTDAPIGIFDSGFGGLTVARSVIDQLPHESIRYLGDTARQPYGPKPIGEVREYALECLDHLVEQGVKALVIACNSASAAMLRDARERYDVPVVEVIYPATRRAVAATRSGRIGVICTRATADSQAYDDAFAAAPHVELTTRACPRFVDFVESGVTSGDELLAVAHSYLDPLTEAGVDTLVLGCTHYPLLTGVISYVVGDDVTLVSSAEECAKDVYKMLVRSDLARPGGVPTYSFVTTGSPAEFETIGRRFLGPEMVAASQFAGGARVRITVIGCSGSYPGPDSPASCYLLEAEHDDGTGPRTWRVVLELGSGALGVLHRYVDPLAIDAVLISHLHADHCLDMSGYYVMRKYHPSGPAPRIPVWGPVDTPGRLARGYDLPEDPGMTGEFDFRIWTTRVEVGPFVVEAIPVFHPVDAYGLRIQADGATLAYTGDTAPCDNLDLVAADADLLLAEASFREKDDNPPGVHLTGADCGRLAARAGVPRMVLTHVPPWHDRAGMLAEAAAVFDGPLELAATGAVYELSRTR